MSNVDPLRNAKDPLHKTGPEAEKELFRALSQVASGFPLETAVASSMNMLLNAVRQSCSTRQAAERYFDETMGRFKSILLDKHYDGAGNRRNIFPFDQTISVSLMKLGGNKG